METVRVLLISTYDLGRQPLGLASPAAWLRNEGVEVTCVDTSRDTLTDDQIGEAGLIAFYLPMHTATRLAAPLIARAGRVNASARLAAYGLYAPLNASWLGEQGVTVLGPDGEMTRKLLGFDIGLHRAPVSSRIMSDEGWGTVVRTWSQWNPRSRLLIRMIHAGGSGSRDRHFATVDEAVEQLRRELKIKTNTMQRGNDAGEAPD